ncbi:MAG: hypothetical protein AAFY34_08360 [Pseudomonadota bacterium]
MTPAIELAAASPRLEMLKTRLKSLGFITCEVRDEPVPFEPILVDIPSASSEQMKSVHRQVMSGVTRPFILVGGDTPPHLDGAITLANERELHRLPGKLAAYYRRANTEQEAAFRVSSIQDLTGTPATPAPRSLPSVLVIGGSSARFLALQAALKANDIDVVAAFTVPTAQDYLTKRDFSAVLIDLGDSRDRRIANQALLRELVAGLPRPLFILQNRDEPVAQDTDVMVSSATEIFDYGMDVQQIATDLVWQTFQHHSAAPITAKQSGNPVILDRLTGLFTRGFLEHHLARQMRESRSVFLPLTFMSLTVTSADDDNASARRYLPIIAKTVETHLRQTDCAARLDWTSLGFSLRCTAYTNAARLAERCSSALVEQSLPENISFAWRICEKRQTHTAESLINATLAARQIRGTIAA